MTEHRFACTACGKCCYGWLPLTLDEALGHADRFPLAIAMTPVKPSEKHYKITTRLGAILPLPAKPKIAIQIMPIAYIPPSLACPELTPDNLCAIHDRKPLRCRSMPFYPYQEEEHQATMLIPRKGLACDTSQTAPVIYRDKRILDRTAFDAEQSALRQDARPLRAYADHILKFNPAILGRVIKAAQSRIAGRVVINFSSFLRIDKRMSLDDFAAQQHPVLEEWIQKTEPDPALSDYTIYYRETSADLARFI